MDLKDFRNFSSLGIDPGRRTVSGIRAAIIREKGVNGDREMAHALYLAGFDVKDVHMTDLIQGRETLEEVSMIVFVGGFSNSDVLGSAKGWAGAFRYNEKARIALEKFYAREDTLSLGICNGCQLMIELNLVVPEHEETPRMLHKHPENSNRPSLLWKSRPTTSVMLKILEGMNLGVWVAHGKENSVLPMERKDYHIAARYSHSTYPANPNGSDMMWQPSALPMAVTWP